MKTNTKRFFATLLSACMLFAQIPVKAFAAASITNVTNQQIQYGISLGDGQSSINEDGVVDVTISLKGTPYIDAEAPTDVILLTCSNGTFH